MDWSAEARASRVEAIIFDVDGVLTRGDLIYGADGEWKVFDVQDGQGFVLARRAGLKLALLSGRSSEVVRRRAEELKVDAFREGVTAKGVAFRELCAALQVHEDETCYVGDDLIDLPALREAGFPVAVANAVHEVLERVAWVTTRRGGEGAAREVVEFILKAKGLWDAMVKHYAEGEE